MIQNLKIYVKIQIKKKRRKVEERKKKKKTIKENLRELKKTKNIITNNSSINKDNEDESRILLEFINLDKLHKKIPQEWASKRRIYKDVSEEVQKLQKKYRKF